MKSTRDTAKELDIRPAALRAHISEGHVKAPVRRIGLSYVWSDSEIEAARKELEKPGRRRPHWFRDACLKGAGSYE